MWACLTFQKSTKIVNRKIQNSFFYLQSFTAATIIMQYVFLTQGIYAT